MSLPALPVLPAPPAMIVADAGALSRYGEALLQAISAQQPDPGADPGHPRADLVQALSRLALALQADNPTQLRRQTSWWGRLLGRDVERQGDAEVLQAQWGVLVFSAQQHAQQLRALGTANAQAAALDLHAAQALEQWADAASVLQPSLPGGAHDSLQHTLQQRVAHLRLLAAMKRIGAVESGLAQAQDAALLEHLQQITGTLLPAWRQAIAAGNAQAHARLQGQAAQLLAQIREHAASAQARLP